MSSSSLYPANGITLSRWYELNGPFAVEYRVLQRSFDFPPTDAAAIQAFLTDGSQTVTGNSYRKSTAPNELGEWGVRAWATEAGTDWQTNDSAACDGYSSIGGLFCPPAKFRGAGGNRLIAFGGISEASASGVGSETFGTTVQAVLEQTFRQGSVNSFINPIGRFTFQRLYIKVNTGSARVRYYTDPFPQSVAGTVSAWPEFQVLLRPPPSPTGTPTATPTRRRIRMEPGSPTNPVSPSAPARKRMSIPEGYTLDASADFQWDGVNDSLDTFGCLLPEDTRERLADLGYGQAPFISESNTGFGGGARNSIYAEMNLVVEWSSSGRRFTA